MTLRFALAIPHAPWRDERVISLTRLTLELAEGRFAHGPVAEQVFRDREPNYIWSLKLWRWAAFEAPGDPTHLIQLQDDVRVCHDFWYWLHCLVSARPDEIIGLESVHPVSEVLARSGGRWYTTTDGLIGVGYVVPIPVLQEFLVWRRDEIRADGVTHLNEDQLLGLFAASTSRRIWHPVPTLIDHDTDLPSTYGNDRHSARRPLVTLARDAVAAPTSWEEPPEKAVHTGLFYAATARLCRRFVRHVHYEDMQRIIDAK